jgi:delta14-sterol reductase
MSSPPNLARDGGAVTKRRGGGDALNPRSKHYEFGGPLGALFVTLVVPFTAYSLYFACNEPAGGCPPKAWDLLATRALDAVANPQWWLGLWDTRASAIYAAWYAFCVIAWAVLPGDTIEGIELRNGQKLKYKMNGSFADFFSRLA